MRNASTALSAALSGHHRSLAKFIRRPRAPSAPAPAPARLSRCRRPRPLRLRSLPQSLLWLLLPPRAEPAAAAGAARRGARPAAAAITPTPARPPSAGPMDEPTFYGSSPRSVALRAADAGRRVLRGARARPRVHAVAARRGGQGVGRRAVRRDGERPAALPLPRRHVVQGGGGGADVYGLLAWRKEHGMDAVRDALVAANREFFEGGGSTLAAPHLTDADRAMMEARPRTFYKAAGDALGSASSTRRATWCTSRCRRSSTPPPCARSRASTSRRSCRAQELLQLDRRVLEAARQDGADLPHHRPHRLLARAQLLREPRGEARVRW